MNLSVAEKIENAFGDMTSSERRVARALMADYPVAGLGTLMELADKAGTSHPTVLRFIKKLGFPTFPGFQEHLRLEVQQSYRTPWLRNVATDAGDAAGGSRHEQLKETLAHNIGSFLNAVPKTEIDEAAQRLISTKGNIIVLGRNMSLPLASYLGRLLHLVRDRIHVVDSSTENLARHLNTLGPRDSVCVFHLPRYDPQLNFFCRQAKTQGSSVMLFTDEHLSPLADIADHVIAAPINTPTMFDSYVVLIIQIELLLDALIAHDPNGFRRRNQSADNLAEKLRQAQLDNQIYFDNRTPNSGPADN